MSDKPADIPADVWKAAEAFDAGLFSGHRGLYLEDFARAILAERERCAEQAILHGHKINLHAAVDAPLSSWKLQRLQSTLQTCEDIAALIRNPQNDNFRAVPHMGPVA